MYRIQRAFPLMRTYIRGCQPTVRNYWREPFVLDVRRMMNDFERSIERFERSFWGDLAPSKQMSIAGIEKGYRLNVDLQGFTPENVKIALQDGMLKISADRLQTREDGTTYRKSVMHEYKLPENVDNASLKSFFHNNGFLTIEAETDCVKETPREIPVETEEKK